jgi:serine/threonine-protein kinase RsbT
MNAIEGEVPIETESDIVLARRAVREAAKDAGFGATDITRIVTAASELARNTFQYGGRGVMRWRCLEQNGRDCLELHFVDDGPGIADVNQAMQEGFTTGRGLGLGLPGAKRLMDELDIESSPGHGTKVVCKKWRK